jgi:hypothetical protein
MEAKETLRAHIAKIAMLPISSLIISFHILGNRISKKGKQLLPRAIQ